jgi:hypothetical protein
MCVVVVLLGQVCRQIRQTCSRDNPPKCRLARHTRRLQYVHNNCRSIVEINRIQGLESPFSDAGKKGRVP